MSNASLYVRWAAIAALAFAGAAPAVAGPTPEEAKALSGMRFGENAGLDGLRADAPAVAGGAPAARATLTAQPAPAPKPTPAPPSPKPPVPAPRAGGISLGTKLLMAIGDAVGAVATVSLYTSAGAAPLALLGLAGAVAGAAAGYSMGDRGGKLAKDTVGGAVAGVAAIALVGAAAGYAAGRALERLFKK